mgnify:FL=1
MEQRLTEIDFWIFISNCSENCLCQADLYYISTALYGLSRQPQKLLSTLIIEVLDNDSRHRPSVAEQVFYYKRKGYTIKKIAKLMQIGYQTAWNNAHVHVDLLPTHTAEEIKVMCAVMKAARALERSVVDNAD